MLTVGIDAHHRYCALCVLDEHGKTVKEHTLRGGVEDVASWVASLKKPARVCYEASLGYGELHDALSEVMVKGSPTHVQVAHPGHLRAIFRSRKKNDRIDARKLATASFLEQVPLVHVPTRDVREWRQLIEHRRRQMDKRVRAMYERVRGGKKEKLGRAIVATAHHLLRAMVAMLKSGEEWRERESPPAATPTATED